jgi:tetratricopeptide (TPR) repeat protein
MKSFLINIFSAIMLAGLSIYSISQTDDTELQKMLDQYLENRDPEISVEISQLAPESKYDLFCQAYSLLDIDNKEGISRSGDLVINYPDFPEAYFVLGTFLINGSKEYETAVAYLDTAIRLKPEFTMAWFNRGIGLVNAGEYEKAINDFNRVIESDSDNAAVYIMRAVANYYSGNLEKLVPDIEIALQMDPYIFSSLYYLQVRKTIDKAIEVAPENANLYYGRGYANLKNGYYRLAVNDFVKAIELVPGSSEFYKLSGVCRIYLEDGPGAESDLKVAMGINPDDPEIYYYMGLLANDVQEQPEMGYEYLSQAIELNPRDPLSYYERAWSSYDLLDYETALDDVEKAIELDSRNGDFYTLRAMTVLFGEIESEYDYCEDFRKAEELGTAYKLSRYIRKYCKE